MVDAPVLGNSRPPQPPHVSEGQFRDIRKPGCGRQVTRIPRDLAPAVGVITPNVLRKTRTGKNGNKKRIETREKEESDRKITEQKTKLQI
jgi:hypothetical protein